MQCIVCAHEDNSLLRWNLSSFIYSTKGVHAQTQANRDRTINSFIPWWYRMFSWSPYPGHHVKEISMNPELMWTTLKSHELSEVQHFTTDEPMNWKAKGETPSCPGPSLPASEYMLTVSSGCGNKMLYTLGSLARLPRWCSRWRIHLPMQET